MGGESHTAQGGPKQIGFESIGHLQDSSVGDPKTELGNVFAKAAFAVVTLTVHISCDHPAQGDSLGAWRRGQVPPLTPEHTVKLLERRACLRSDHTMLGIERQQPIGAGGNGHHVIAWWRKRRVAVRTTQTSGQDCALSRLLKVLRQPLTPSHNGMTAPTGHSPERHLRHARR
jgi:hypothetical protein